MKKFGKGMLLFAAAVAGLTSCSDESPWAGSDSEGGINLKFSSDARVVRQTRADDNISPVVPDASQFTVNLAKSDGTYSKSWSGVDGFNREQSFPIGDYVLSASYGDTDQEGFDNPCFRGSTNVHVSPGDVAEAQITATLANAMVSIRYTDDFKENFPQYSAAVQSEGHDWVVFAMNETRPAYISPSQVKLNLTLTNADGLRQTIQPATFTAVARHHYVVTIGVSNPVSSGDLALDVQFEENVENETVNVLLGDELFSAPAPSVKAFDVAKKSSQGYELDPSALIEKYEYVEPEVKPEFHVFSYGGLKSATLTVVGYTPTFGSSVELVGADAVTQSQLKNDGVACYGFFNNVDKMGVVNVANFLQTMPAGEYTIELQAVDALTRTSEPVKFSVKINPVEIQISSPADMEFMADEIAVRIATNAPGNENNIRFTVGGVNATVNSVTTVSSPSAARTRAGLEYVYEYKLATSPKIVSQVNVGAKLGRHSDAVTVNSKAPEYEIETDAFARKVALKINAANDATAAIIMDKASFWNGDTQIPTSNISVNNGIILISGLNPGVQYLSLKVKLGEFEKAIPEFITETEEQVPNGSFSNLNSAFTISKIDAGGQYEVKVAFITDNYTNYSSISFQEPTGWATINQKTCYTGSNPMNTWFVVPSTFASDGKALMRTVGYSHNGTLPSKSGGQMNTNYYCENAPAYSSFDIAAGELFLGSYTFNGSESRTDGISFSTRPSTLSFDYTYTPLTGSGETGEALISVYDDSNNLLATNHQYINAGSSTASIDLPSYPFGKKAARLCVSFKSTRSGLTPKIHVPSGSELKGDAVVNIRGDRIISGGANAYSALATGSVLIVDNVRLGYEATSVAANSPKKAKARR